MIDEIKFIAGALLISVFIVSCIVGISKLDYCRTNNRAF